MSGIRTASLIAIYLLQCLFYITLDAKAQKNGFRGGSKSYEIHVEASPIGTNLHYELPESKVKAASKQDWLVDNDNAEMIALNSPVLATVNVKHPKFSMKGQWPGYTTSFKLPEDVSVASKRHDFSKPNHVKHQKIGSSVEQYNAILSQSGDQASGEDAKADKEPVGSGVVLSKVAERFFKQRKRGRNLRHGGSLGMLNISRLLLPIARLKNIDMKNPHVSKAMKGVIKRARKVVDEAKMVLNDAARFITGVRKLVKVTKEHKKMTKASVVVKETEEAGSKSFPKNVSKQELSLSQEKSGNDNGRIKSVKLHHQSLQSHLFNQKYNRREGQEKEWKGRLDQGARSVKGMSKRSYHDSSEAEKAQGKEEGKKIKRRELPDTLESILYTIRGLKNLLKYH